jgi:hypothetical protein
MKDCIATQAGGLVVQGLAIDFDPGMGCERELLHREAEISRNSLPSEQVKGRESLGQAVFASAVVQHRGVLDRQERALCLMSALLRVPVNAAGGAPQQERKNSFKANETKSKVQECKGR